MPSLRELLDAATRPKPPYPAEQHPREWSQYAHDRRVIEKLAPELAALCLDMGELLRGRLSHSFVPGSDGDTDAYALLARLDRIGKEPQATEGGTE